MTVRASGSTPGCQRVICVTAGELPLGASLQLPLKNGRDRWTKHNGNFGVMPISQHGGIVPFTSCSAEYGITPLVNVTRRTGRV